MAKHNPGLYRAMHNLRKGRLHRYLNVPQGETIPAEKLSKAKNSSNPSIAKAAHFAETMSHFKH